MSQQPPADIGMPLAEVDTPALVVELGAFERNLRRMAEEIRAAGVAHRPHAKTHKSPLIGRRQIALGAVGVCCQKVSEAEAMVIGGIDDVLVSNQVVGVRKLRRLAALARQARIGVCVDDAGNVAELSAAASAAGATLQVLVEVDVGAARCGVAPGPSVAELARLVVDSAGLIVPPSDPTALAGACERLLKMSVASRQQMTTTGRQRIVSEFDIDTILNRYQQLFLPEPKDVHTATYQLPATA